MRDNTNMFTVYILRTSSNTLYIGQTNNLEKRLKEHQTKGTKSAKYTRYFSNLELVYSETYSTRKEAMQREAQLKRWTKAKKEVLICGDKIKPSVGGNGNPESILGVNATPDILAAGHQGPVPQGVLPGINRLRWCRITHYQKFG